ncbi:MAG: molybdopterin-dependent oxidoreductase [Proteobacteria bacterium]|nr:molybdopterin-dependent oxidoreductase [Pseudomonadota bacterium]NIS68769.1 molybdopterin-dependent oxidoreductase [Pseudomonadota bacterium]
MDGFNRREFLKWSLAGVAGLAVNTPKLAFLQPVTVDNPLGWYPDRAWEKVYRDKYRYDSVYHFTCAPNDTHNCLLRAYVRNGIVVMAGPTYGFGDATDSYGNKASHRWEPRCCQKGLVLNRRFYGDRRVKSTMVRKGFYEWVEAGFPRDPDTGKPPEKYFNRGQDRWLKMSHNEAYNLVARALMNISHTYSGEIGKGLLQRQGYDPDSIDAMKGAGTQVLKLRGGMPLLGVTRLLGLVRAANMMALLDNHIRQTGPERSLGARHFDNYSWHTDLPPGHPMVTGQQTVDVDLSMAERSSLITLWGMNWISTKMPDAHWLTEAKQRGTKVINVSIEYQSTANKSDEVIIIRPATDHALILGLSNILMGKKLYDEEYVKSFTDLPILVRTDTLQYLRASDIIEHHQPFEIKNYASVLKKGESTPAPSEQAVQYIPEEIRGEWGDFVVWDRKTGQPRPLNRDLVGRNFAESKIDPALTGKFLVKTVEGIEVEVRPVFDIVLEYAAYFTPQRVSEITWAPERAIENLARELVKHKGSTFFAVGMGPNQFFNASLKDRGIFLLAALTGNIGRIGGSPGSYAGNYRVALYNGLPQYIAENPFSIELNPDKPAKVKPYLQFESAHYFSHGDKPLRLGNKLFTGKTHTPTPSKFLWFANSNSIIGNAKWSYDLIVNTIPKLEAIVMHEWWWSMSCEYSDVVFAVDSWGEFKHPDLCGSVTNPFNQVFPRSPLKRIFDTVGDIDVYAGVAERLAALTGDKRFEDYWRFVYDDRVDAYLERIAKASTALKGFTFKELEERAIQGIPTMKNLRTYPKVVGWEQTHDAKPWYTKTGRLEFYREEPEFIEHGENIPVFREAVDATFHEPNVIVSKDMEILRPSQLEDYGLKKEDLSAETRQVRNVVKSWEELKKTRHPLTKEDGFRFLFITPKYRHAAHSMPIDIDMITVYYGPFGDLHRHDKRKPWVGEAYVNMNPDDAMNLGINDGDYVWIDADPDDRPYRGWKDGTTEYKVARMMCRVRYYSAIPKGVLQMWHNMYQSTHGSVTGHETNPDRLARNPETKYQAIFRYGGHQSCTRAWLGPTLMTDSLVRKGVFGQKIGKGFAADIHCPVGAPRESFTRVIKAEDGGIEGKGLWRPAALGFRAGYENEMMRSYLEGKYLV